MTTHDRSAVRARLRRWFGRKPLIRPTSRRRVLLFLGINLLAYAFTTAFLHYLSSGRWLNTSLEDLAGAMRRLPGDALLVGPLPIFSYPWMIVIYGLLLAVMIMVPLLVACLYHSRYCVLFLLCTFLLGAAPVLTLFLAAGCMLVAATPLRSSSPMLALLLGLAPVAVYLYLAGRYVSITPGPLRRWMLYAPLVLAVVAAVIGNALVLTVAWLTRYRPGVIWPVLLALLATPAYLFFTQVGTDEVAYALLADRLTAGHGVFSQEALQPWLRRHAPPDGPADPRQLAQQDLETRKARLAAECERFLRRYPDSPRRPAVLWILGITLDSQVDLRRLDGGLLRYDHSHPLPASQETWRRLAEQYPADARAGLAHLRLAQLAIREGKLVEAQERLAGAARLLPAAASPTTAPADAVASLFDPRPSVPAADYLPRAGHEVRALQWLLAQNHLLGDSDLARRSAEAFVEEAKLDPLSLSRWEYTRRLADLRRRYGDTYWSDNLELSWALSRPDPLDQARALLPLLEARHPDGQAGDAVIPANYWLWWLAMREGGNLNGELQPPQTYADAVLAPPADPWEPLVQRYRTTLAAVDDGEQP